MVSVRSVKVDGESIYIFNSAIYIFESSMCYTLQLDVIVSEVVVNRYKTEEQLIIEVELEDGRIISSIMHLKTVPGGLPQLNLFCDIEDPDEYSGLDIVSESDSEFPDIETGITLEDIRKVEMPNEKVTLKLNLPINQVEWLKNQKARDLNAIIKELLESHLR
ncbi:hypothetical protein [Mesobacillus maritimus]|uniref:hypothetical protein n=1 Tax=Mesobacillus maritimus TaxID=1643336 RepID=UPI00384E1AED